VCGGTRARGEKTCSTIEIEPVSAEESRVVAVKPGISGASGP